MAGLQTEFGFTLPKGFVDDAGTLHRTGTMRLATARDEIEPLRSNAIDGPDDPYLTVMVLARVITELGSIDDVTTDHVERLFAADLAFLQDLYGIINFGDQADVAALQATVEPSAPVEFADESSIDDVQPDAAAPTEPPPASTATRSRARIEEISRPSVP